MRLSSAKNCRRHRRRPALGQKRARRVRSGCLRRPGGDLVGALQLGRRRSSERGHFEFGVHGVYDGVGQGEHERLHAQDLFRHVAPLVEVLEDEGRVREPLDELEEAAEDELVTFGLVVLRLGLMRLARLRLRHPGLEHDELEQVRARALWDLGTVALPDLGHAAERPELRRHALEVPDLEVVERGGEQKARNVAAFWVVGFAELLRPVAGLARRVEAAEQDVAVDARAAGLAGEVEGARRHFDLADDAQYCARSPEHISCALERGRHERRRRFEAADAEHHVQIAFIELGALAARARLEDAEPLGAGGPFVDGLESAPDAVEHERGRPPLLPRRHVRLQRLELRPLGAPERSAGELRGELVDQLVARRIGLVARRIGRRRAPVGPGGDAEFPVAVAARGPPAALLAERGRVHRVAWRVGHQGLVGRVIDAVALLEHLEHHLVERLLERVPRDERGPLRLADAALLVPPLFELQLVQVDEHPRVVRRPCFRVRLLVPRVHLVGAAELAVDAQDFAPAAVLDVVRRETVVVEAVAEHVPHDPVHARLAHAEQRKGPPIGGARGASSR
mmetsp:Transcript_15655/g.55717  ORF Transcript_15655/g.55717 Transcript_15655/m.55717 type:complete len:566 (+) Transcript_15655:49-1746(+)